MSCLSRAPRLRSMLNITEAEARLVEFQVNLLSSQVNRKQGALQESLATATYLANLVEPCRALGLGVEAAALKEAANALWEHGEMAPSINMLQELLKEVVLNKQTIPVGKSDLLAKIGYQVSVARLEKPDRIIDNYLLPALTELKNQKTGSEAGQVFHEFAIFCDQQLQDPDNLEDLERLRRLREMKSNEVKELEQLKKSAGGREKYMRDLVKAKQWLQLDDQEYRRLHDNREEFLRQSLENYLLAMAASDEHDKDALRFTALWLEHANKDIAIRPVSEHMKSVPTQKFVTLMNQLSSRLVDDPQSDFQNILSDLVTRICIDHPYHGMYQIYAGAMSGSHEQDESAKSRQRAAYKLSKGFGRNPETLQVWNSVRSINGKYCDLAKEEDKAYKAGLKMALAKSPAALALNASFRKHRIPPPTMHIPISSDLNYENVPRMMKLQAGMSIASGVSAPKIITIIGSDGSSYKQLVRQHSDFLDFH